MKYAEHCGCEASKLGADVAKDLKVVVMQCVAQEVRIGSEKNQSHDKLSIMLVSVLDFVYHAYQCAPF